MQTGVDALFPVRDQVHIASYGADDAWQPAGHGFHQGKAQALPEGDEEEDIRCGVQLRNIWPVAQKMDAMHQMELAAKGNVVFQLLPTTGAQQVNMGIRNAGHGLQHHAVIFVFCHFRNGQKDKIIFAQSKGDADGIPLCGVILEALQLDAYALDIFQTLGMKVLPGEFIVLSVDCDEHVREEGCDPLRREKHQPVQQRCTLVEMVAVGGVNHLAALFPGIPGGKTGEKSGHRSVAVDHVEVTLINDAFQLLVGPDIVPGQGRTAKGYGVIFVAIGNVAFIGIIVVIFGGYGGFPAHFLQHFQIGNVKLYDVGLDDSRHKEHFFLCQKDRLLGDSDTIGKNQIRAFRFRMRSSSQMPMAAPMAQRISQKPDSRYTRTKIIRNAAAYLPHSEKLKG